MALLERVATLIRANLNDLIDKAEDPEKMIKQVITDMENQLLQVKTQVAVAIADLHLLEKKRMENDQSAAEWMKKAELAVDKQRDDLARTALERHKSGEQLSESYRQQIDDQHVQVENLKSALKKLEQKLAEAQAKSQMLVAQHRRARALSKASDAQLAMGDRSKVATFERLKTKVMHGEAVSQAKSEMVADSVEEEFARLSGEDDIERRLAELKARRTSAHP